MAQVTLNPVFVCMRGTVGDLVFKNVNGTTVVTRKAHMTVHEETAPQRATRENFRRGIQYGKTVTGNPAVRAIYAEAAKQRRHPIFSVMISDFMNPPSVDEIDLSRYNGQVGSEIAIRASDDFGVTELQVRILNSDGEEIEKGFAVESAPNSGVWGYAATVAIPTGNSVRVEATAKDRPGHMGVKVENAG